MVGAGGIGGSGAGVVGGSSSAPVKGGGGLTPSEAAAAGGVGAAVLAGGGGDDDESDEDADCCPTCLEVYTDSNPRTWTRCGHHFHLQCLYEWLERKETCPLCESQVEFDELV